MNCLACASTLARNPLNPPARHLLDVALLHERVVERARVVPTPAAHLHPRRRRADAPRRASSPALERQCASTADPSAGGNGAPARLDPGGAGA